MYEDDIKIFCYRNRNRGFRCMKPPRLGSSDGCIVTMAMNIRPRQYIKVFSFHTVHVAERNCRFM
jgi:hypothetical protein